MTATHALPSWPAPVAANWRFGQTEDGTLRWVMRRNCSLAPRQLVAVYVALSALSLAVAGAFWIFGAPLVMPFAWAELLGLGIALVVYARHAADRETITLAGEQLRVEHRCGNGIEQVEFRAAWVRVEPLHGEDSLVELSGQGQRMQVGRYLRPELRAEFARELRRALRGERGAKQGLRELELK